MKILPNNIAVLAHDTHISKWVEQSGRLDHDQWLIPQLLPFIPEGGTVVDCGANIGDHTIAYLRAVGSEGTVIAIEPNGEACECLRHNCPDAVCIQAAVGMEMGTVSLVKETNVGASHCEPGGTIHVVTLDGLRLPKCDFIKLDIEGWEHEALKGAEKLIEKFSPVLVVEVNGGALERQRSSEAELLQFIESLGYNTHAIPHVGPQYDLICTPK